MADPTTVSTHQPRTSELEFLRPQFVFEREFGQFRNWWARDKRIVGNAFSLLMYLVSHQRTFRITQQKARHDLGLGRDAFLAARRRLETAGFLSPMEFRYPAGTTDDFGRPVGGHRYIVYSVNDPAAPSEKPGPTPVEASADNPRRPPEPASPENPTPGFPLLKNTTSQEDQDSSSAMDDELRSDKTLDRVRSRLENAGQVDVDALDLELARREILAASRRPVGDPVAYIAASIEREPSRWVYADRSQASSRNQLDRSLTRNAEPHIHRYIGYWNEICAGCDAERPGWRLDRDADEPLTPSDNLEPTPSEG